MAEMLARQVEKILTSAVGEFIAKATVKKNCALINCEPENLTPDKLPELATHIEKSVAFFSDPETGATVAQKIRDLA